jgi:hypothetical protein
MGLGLPSPEKNETAGKTAGTAPYSHPDVWTIAMNSIHKTGVSVNNIHSVP